MEFKKRLKLELLVFLLLNVIVLSMARKKHVRRVNWVVKETPYTRLCSTKKILTVNGLFPGPPLYVHKGEKLIVNVRNQGKYNVTLHWHGVKQPRNPWSDGPEYVTQCPIKSGASFSYEIMLSEEEGTLWWHAHSDWSRATVYGPIIIYPKIGTTYPFSKPHAEFPIILGSWYKIDMTDMIQSAYKTGADFNLSDSFTINGQPGDLYNCSQLGTSKIIVDYGKTYLLRIINAILNEEMFFMVAHHNLRVIGIDGAYIKPIETDYVMITPGQTMDILFIANQSPNHYYMAARAYGGIVYDDTTTTAIVKYSGNYKLPSTPSFPNLPNYTDIHAVTNFTKKIRALASEEYPIDVPKSIDTRLLMTISVNTLPCGGSSTCDGPNGDKFAASMNNVSFVPPKVDILQAYHKQIRGIYTTDFPRVPPFFFNFTADRLADNLLTPKTGAKVRVLDFNSSVEIVFQGTSLLGGENHPMHLHGYSFYVVGSGFGNFDNQTDPKRYNLVDPPKLNTIGVPTNGWAAIRFRADNPGVWFLHCHLEKHSTWGMNTVLIVKNGKTRATSMRRPPRHLTPC